MIRITTDVSMANAITHSGTFHADEVFATVILSKLKDISLCRTSSPIGDVSFDTIVYDVGLGTYDHHQPGGNGVRANGVPYSSAGLIWRDFGPVVCRETPDPDAIWQTIDRELIQNIDAVDNGAMPRVDYACQKYGISQAIAAFYPTWDSEEPEDVAFMRAVSFAETVFDNLFSNAVAKVRAQEKLEKAFEETWGPVMILDQYLPWQDFLFKHPERKKAYCILYVIYPSNRGGYSVYAVPTRPGGYDKRKPFPDEWCGYAHETLQHITGVATATFCHPKGFICGAETLVDAIRLANLAAKA